MHLMNVKILRLIIHMITNTIMNQIMMITVLHSAHVHVVELQ